MSEAVPKKKKDKLYGMYLNLDCLIIQILILL